MQCKNVTPTRPLCGPVSLFSRSYASAPRWPFTSPLHLVMEGEPGECDFYRSTKPCCDWSQRPESLVEHSVREAIVAVLGRCSLRHARPCQAVDFGANNGWMTLFMLALGANVTSVEPASDFAAAIADSARLNCWDDRHRMINAFACEKNDRGPRGCMRSRRPWNGYRAGGGGRDGLREILKETTGRTVSAILTGEGSPSSKHYDLLKLDGDGPEGSWMRAIDALLSTNRISVGAILLEGNNLDESTMAHFQWRHGFHVFRLDDADNRRHMNADGWDDFSPAGTIAKLTRFPTSANAHSQLRGWARDELEDEVFGLRGIKHAWRIKDNLTRAQWNILLSPIGPYDAKLYASRLVSGGGNGYQWLLVKESIGEPVLPPSSRAMRWRASRGLAR